MDLSVNKRFKEYVDIKKIDQVEIVETIQVEKTQISKWLKPKIQISGTGLIAIVKNYKDIDARWLLTGEGSMFEATYQQQDNRYSANDSPQPPPIPQRRCNDPGCNAELLKLNDEIVRYKLIIDQLINRADILRKDDPPEKYVTGGVAKSGQKAPNKKAG